MTQQIIFVIIRKILILKLYGCNIQGMLFKVLDKVKKREGVLKKAIFIINSIFDSLGFRKWLGFTCRVDGQKSQGLFPFLFNLPPSVLPSLQPFHLSSFISSSPPGPPALSQWGTQQGDLLGVLEQEERSLTEMTGCLPARNWHWTLPPPSLNRRELSQRKNAVIFFWLQTWKTLTLSFFPTQIRGAENLAVLLYFLHRVLSLQVLGFQGYIASSCTKLVTRPQPSPLKIYWLAKDMHF